ncbi:hypothetical protein FHG87_007156 [Trinorchestia longiramus]|nr:hypothetical protein FHG87_007156 [Trinorchestia longiramus]
MLKHTQSLQLASPKSSVTNITKASPSLPKPQLPPASPTTVGQKFSDDNAGEDELSVLNDVHLASMFRKKGFYKASSESLSMLGHLSSTRRISASESTEDVLAYDTRHQLARHLLASCPRNESVVFSEHFNLAYTSVVEVDQSENLDSLCERDEENNYTDEIVGGDFKAVEIKPMAVNREKFLKKSLGNVASKVLENETKDIVVNFDNITQERASYRDLYCSTVAYMKELEIGQVCEAECPVVHQWNDKILHPMNLSCNKNAASSRSNNTQKTRSSWSVQRALKAHDRTTNNINDLEENKSSVLDVNTIPQEWARLLSAMSQDSSNRKFENPLEEDILDEEMNAVCDSDTAETENNFIGFNSSDIPKVSTSTAFLQRKRSAMMEKLGNFLYDLTQEMLEDNIRDLTSSQSRKEVKTSVNGERSSKSGEGANWVNDRSTKTVKVEKNSEYTSIPKENFDALLLALGSPSKSAKNYIEQMNASRELFHCVLEWLAEEAAYYRNVEKKLLPKRSDSTSEQHMKVMSSALIILQHLLPLRFSCQHLPPPMTVLAFLLYPLDTTTSMALSSSVLLLPCLQESASHPDSVMTPELAQLLVERMSRAAHCATSSRHLTFLLRCLAALSSDRNFVQSLCSLADECLVWRLCLRLLDFCDVVLPNGCQNHHSNLDREVPSSSLTVRQVVALMKTHSAATFYAVRNIVSGSMEMPGPSSQSCIKAFYRWMVSALLAKPAWLFSDCHCNIVLLATLLVVVHSAVNTLVEGLPLIHEMKQLFCQVKKFQRLHRVEHKFTESILR